MNAKRAVERPVRGLVLLALLFGPLALGELWARQQLELVYPHLVARRISGWVDAKLMLLERAGCPRVLAIGSSETIHSLSDSQLGKRKLEFDGRLEPVGSFFNFGLQGAQATLLYAVWRQIQAQDCTPDYLLLEISPTVVIENSPWPGGYAAVLDFQTWWRLPAGFREHLGSKVTRLIGYATTNRLLLRRLRGALVTALAFPPDLSTLPAWQTTLALDGRIVPPNRGEVLTSPGVDRERRKRLELQAEGIYDFRVGPVETTALRSLVDEVSESGARLVIHTPPVSGIYHEIIDRGAAMSYLEGLRRELLNPGGRRDADGAPPIIWVWCYSAAYGPTYFFDWIHLNEKGAGRYADALFPALARHSGDLDGCQIHEAR